MPTTPERSEEIAASLPESATTLLVDRYLTDRPSASVAASSKSCVTSRAGTSTSRSTAASSREALARVRQLIREADPGVVEEVKWRKPSNPSGVPTWSHDGIICTGESYKSVVKLTFPKGASLKAPARLFNSSLEGNTRRAIDIHEGEEVDESAFKALVKAAVAVNSSGKSKSAKKAKS